MLALSVRQPAAEAILRGTKTIEYRGQPTKIRERIFIYASLGRYPRDEEDSLLAEFGITGVASDDLPRGLLVGTVELWNCWAIDFDSYEWHLRKPQRLKTPLKPTNRVNPVWSRQFDNADPPITELQPSGKKKASQKTPAKAAKKKTQRR